MRIPRYIIRTALSLCGLFGLLIVIGTVQTLSSCDWKDNPDTALATDYYNHTADLSVPIDECGNPLYPLDYQHELADDNEDNGSFQVFTQYGTATIREEL